MKSWILGTLASLLTLSLCGTIISTTLDNTVVNAHYLENKFAAVNGYNRLSAVLTNDVVTQSGVSDVPQLSSVVEGIVSPTAVKQRVDSAFSALQAYLQGQGSAPSINLNDLASQAQAAGVPIGQNSSLLSNVTLGPKSSGTNHTSVNIESYSKATIVVSVVLGVIILLLSLVWRRYTALPGVLISTGIIMLIISLVAYFIFGNINRYFAFSGGSDSFAVLGRDLAQEIGKDLARRFGVVAAASLVVGIISRILAGRLQKQMLKPQVPDVYPSPAGDRTSI